MDKNKIYEILLDDIVHLKIAPGEFIKEVELSESFNLSRTPMREIIKKLALQGYIDVLPRYGNRVSLIEVESVKQMVYMRIILEAEVHNILALKIKPEQIDVLSNIIEEQKKSLSGNNIDEFWELDNTFHHTMFAFAGKKFWWTTIKTNEAHYMRFRRLEMIDNTNYELLHYQHKEILDSIKQRSFENFRSNMENHVGACIGKLSMLQEKYSQYFSRGENENNI